MMSALVQVCAFNRTVQKVDDFLSNEAKGTRVIGAGSLEEMVAKLKKPRRVMLLVKAGGAVDDFIQKLVKVYCIDARQCDARQCVLHAREGGLQDQTRKW